MSDQTIKISLPPMSGVVRQAVLDPAPLVLICTPDPTAAPTGVADIILAQVLEGCLNRRRFTAAWVSPTHEAWQRKFERICRGLPAQVESRYGEVRVDESLVAFRDTRRQLRVPVDLLDLIVLDRIDECAASLYDSARAHLRRGGRVVMLAQPHEGSHWCRNVGASVHRLSWDDGVVAGLVRPKEVADARRTLSPHEFAVRYEGADQTNELIVPYAGSTLKTFAIKRLKVRTMDVPPATVPFSLRPIQRRYLAMQRLGRIRGYRMFVLLKYRRGGFTTTEQAKNYRHWSTRRDARVLTLADIEKNTKTIFQIAKRFHANDPFAPMLKGLGSEMRLYAPGTESHYTIGTAAANAPGRGDTLDYVHCSEVSKWGKGPNRAAMVDDLLAGLTQAAAGGEVVLESTPNGIERFCEIYREAKAGRNAYWPIFLRWFDDPNNHAALGTFNPEQVRETLAEDELNLLKLWRFDHQLTQPVAGWDHRFLMMGLGRIAWRRQKQRELQRLFRQEYPEDDETCFLTSGACYFNASFIVDLLESLPDYTRDRVEGVEYRAIDGGYYVQWAKPGVGEQYVIGVDTSEGNPSSDPCGYGVICRGTGEQVEAAHGLFTPRRLAELVVAAHRRYNGALVGIEKEGPGGSVLERVIDMGVRMPRRHLYHYAEGKAGWSTNAVSRPIMLNDLAESIYNTGQPGGIGVRDRHMLAECLTFVKQSGGEYAAGGSAHDDCVMKWAIARQMMKVPAAGPHGVREVQWGNPG